jgi:hypothetical protein
VLLNHTKKAFLTGPIRWRCYCLRSHRGHRTNFNQSQTSDVQFLAILIFYRDSWRRSRFRLNINSLYDLQSNTRLYR